MTDKPSLKAAFEAPEVKRRYVRRLFATIADRYDLITVLLSFARDRHWKAQLLDLTEVRSGWRVLDLACGTGDIAFEAARRGAAVTGLDITPRMVELAQEKEKTTSGDVFPLAGTEPDARGRFLISWIVGDMIALPIASGCFDLVTTGYGLRNVSDLPRALAEIHRVLKPGGRMGSLDFDRPDARWVRRIYLGYLTAVGSALGWILHRDPDTYRYIPASIGRYPGARGVAALMHDAGFIDVVNVPVFGGFMAIHLARKPASTPEGRSPSVPDAKCT